MEKTKQPKSSITSTTILPNEEIISNIINSEEFRKKLETISANYTNLKQENVIRNYILERLNEYFFENGDSEKKAFAEHPRHNGSRVDLSIIDSKKRDQPYKIEFKYQFSGDNKNMTDYTRIIEKDFELRKSDLFILIIAHWKKSDKKDFDENHIDHFLMPFPLASTQVFIQEPVCCFVPFQEQRYFRVLNATSRSSPAGLQKNLHPFGSYFLSKPCCC